MEPSVTLFGPVDTLVGPYIEYIILVLVLANIGARALEYSQHVSQAEEGDEAITRGAPRVATNALLVVTSFYYMTLHAHAGMVMSVLVLGMVITDVFEFESRKVEARQGWDLDRPMGAIGASVLVFLYAAFQSLFFLVAPIWDAIV
jgi:ABC-type transport system involved in cytochrome c biogenesis permease subunit